MSSASVLFFAAATAALWFVHTARAAAQDPAWVLPGDSVPSDTVRLIALGTGTPSVYKEQVVARHAVITCVITACAQTGRTAVMNERD